MNRKDTVWLKVLLDIHGNNFDQLKSILNNSKYTIELIQETYLKILKDSSKNIKFNSKNDKVQRILDVYCINNESLFTVVTEEDGKINKIKNFKFEVEDRNYEILLKDFHYSHIAKSKLIHTLSHKTLQSKSKISLERLLSESRYIKRI